MATRSLIGRIREDKSVQVIYCHWDGYPEFVGLQLALNYTNTLIIQELLDLGDRSSLTGAPTADRTYAVTQNAEIKPTIYANMDEFKAADKSGADYVYIWDNGWEIFKADYDNNLSSIGTIDQIQLRFAAKTEAK